MSTNANGWRFCLPPEVYETLNLPAIASTAISPGDLLCFDPSTGRVEPVSKGTAGISDTAAYIGASFCGVAMQGKLAADTSYGTPGYPTGTDGIVVALSCIYMASVTGSAQVVGYTVVGVPGSDSTVAIGNTSGSIIGQLLQPKVGSGTETLRVRLVGKFSALRAADAIP